MIDTTLAPTDRNAVSSVFAPLMRGLARIVMAAAQMPWGRPAAARDLERSMQAAARREEARRRVDRLLIGR